MEPEMEEYMMGNWPSMMGEGYGHWLVLVIVAVLLLYPIGKILGRIGFSPFWSIVAVIPVLNLIGLWVMAFTEWPRK
jgi:hypothetical protein